MHEHIAQCMCMACDSVAFLTFCNQQIWFETKRVRFVCFCLKGDDERHIDNTTTILVLLHYITTCNRLERDLLACNSDYAEI